MKVEEIKTIIIDTIQLDKESKYDFEIDYDILPYLIRNRLEGAFYFKYLTGKINCKIPEVLLRDLRIKFEYYNLRDSYIKKVLSEIDLLFSNKYPYKITKGIELSELLYTKGIRYFGDIDLIIRSEDLNGIKKDLFDAGYQQGRLDNWKFKPVDKETVSFFESNTHQTMSFIKTFDYDRIPICLDINFAMGFDNNLLNPAFLQYIMAENDKCININNRDIPALSYELLFINICANLYRDGISLIKIKENKDIYLYQYMDVYTLIWNSNMNYQKLGEIIQEFDLYECVYYSVKNLSQLGVPVPDKLNNIISKYENHEIINRIGNSLDLKHGLWKIDISDRIFGNDRISKILFED